MSQVKLCSKSSATTSIITIELDYFDFFVFHCHLEINAINYKFNLTNINY